MPEREHPLMTLLRVAWQCPADHPLAAWPRIFGARLAITFGFAAAAAVILAVLT
jgi:hypothetical protein